MTSPPYRHGPGSHPGCTITAEQIAAIEHLAARLGVSVDGLLRFLGRSDD